ncbi:ABC transporter permease subunit [Acidothermaceae bacterium B102]|nr:ABC transporter permease subunit [Acidothermaceae bacterium B102]
MTAVAQVGGGGRTLALRLNRRGAAALIIVVWIVLFAAFRGHNTLSLDPSSLTSVHTHLNDLNANIGANRNTNPLFVYFFNEIQVAVSNLTTFFQSLISTTWGSRPLPLLGWLGVVAILTLGSWAAGNVKVAALTLVGFVFVGLQGLWQPAMDTLALTTAAVLISLVIGVPLGIWAGVSDRFNAIVTPFLDFAQTMPTFVYLAPLTLLFLIGPATGVIATLIYAMPPTIRITAHGIRSVPRAAIEASESLGSTKAQTLRTVMLPLARRTIVIGINQTILAALAMVTIAALVAAPGLGQTVLTALESQDVGTAFNAGLAIVIIGVVFDRATTAASARTEAAQRGGKTIRTSVRRGMLAAAAVVAVVLAYLSYTYVWAATFPDHLTIGGTRHSIQLGPHIESWATSATDWAQRDLPTLTNGLKDQVTYHAINPLQTFLDTSPWWVTFSALVLLALVIGGRSAAVIAAVCLGLIIATGLWQDSMDTLAATLLATVVVMVIGVVVGVWMGRDPRVDRVIRPLLDAAQVMPAFVYLVPFVALFAASRFTGIIAAVVYAAPVATKIVADGICGVSETTVEAARAAGSNTWQVITKVQLPMSIRTLALATNQGLIYVLAMVVVGGLVGGGALGFAVIQGFVQDSYFGKGLAAGLAIVLLGIFLDRTTQAAARRADPGAQSLRS